MFCIYVIHGNIVSIFLRFLIDCVVVNNIFLEMVEKQVTRPINNMSAHKVTFLYICIISRGTGTISVFTIPVRLRVTLDMSDAGSGPYTFSATLASLTVTEVFLTHLKLI